MLTDYPEKDYRDQLADENNSEWKSSPTILEMTVVEVTEVANKNRQIICSPSILKKEESVVRENNCKINSNCYGIIPLNRILGIWGEGVLGLWRVWVGL